MKDELKDRLSRKDFLHLSALGISSLVIADMAGCACIPGTDPPAIDYSGSLLIVNASIVNVHTGTVTANGFITIRDGRIVETGIDPGREPQPGFSSIIDLNGKYVIPGLIDAHCHTTLPAASRFNLSALPAISYQLKRNHVQQVENGVTMVRDMGAIPNYLHDAIDMIKKGKLQGPEIIHCNAFTNIKGGHPDIDLSDLGIWARFSSLFADSSNVWFTSVKELKKSLRESMENGASFIKLTMDNLSLLCGAGAIPVYSDEHLRVIFDFAGKHNMPVAGHIHRKFGFDRGLEYGINSMEHGIGDARISDEEIMLMAKKNIAIVPTVTVGQVYASEEAYEQVPEEFRNDYIDNEVRIRREYLESSPDRFIEMDIHRGNVESLAWYKKIGCEKCYDRGIMLPDPELYYSILKYMPENIPRMKEAGVLIGCGTDAGVPLCYHGSLFREMEALTRIGFSNKEALQCATMNNAKILGKGDEAGLIRSRYRADLAVLDGDPLEDIRACRNPVMSIKNGKLAYVRKGAHSISGKTLTLK